MNPDSDFVIGRDVGFVGRWFRLIVGVYFSVLAIAGSLGAGRPDPAAFLAEVGLYLAALAVGYIAAVALLGERVLARANPWFGTLLLLGPLGTVTALEVGPPTFQLAIGLYYSLASVLNFAMSYGGCEVVALPSLLLRRRYTLYCPYNAVDSIENALRLASPSQRTVAVLSMAVAVVVGGYFLLIEEFGLLASLGATLDLDDRWALLLLIPIGYLGFSSWEALRSGEAGLESEGRKLGVGGAVLTVLMLAFLVGQDTLPLFGPVLLLGVAAAAWEALRGRGRASRLANREGS